MPYVIIIRQTGSVLIDPVINCQYSYLIHSNVYLMTTNASKNIETFDNPNTNRDYTIRIKIPEFTCLCPKTGQPDFATLHLEYVPDQHCIELKSLKLYVWSFRDEGAFHEAITNRILDDLVATCKPRYMRITAEFNVRGGIYTTVVTDYRQNAWSKPTPISLP